jgi:hypothetical protein
MEYLAGEYCHAFISPRNYICSLGKIKIFHHTILYPMSCAKYKGMRRVSSKKKGGGCKGMATAIISQSQIAMDINPTALFIRLIIYLFQLIFPAETVFFSRNKSANNIFLLQQINTTVFYDAHIFC